MTIDNKSISSENWSIKSLALLNDVPALKIIELAYRDWKITFNKIQTHKYFSITKSGKPLAIPVCSSIWIFSFWIRFHESYVHLNNACTLHKIVPYGPNFKRYV